jgi:hypothetical protein
LKPTLAGRNIQLHLLIQFNFLRLFAAADCGQAEQMTQLIPPPLLAKANKILFVTHLAIGDFTYMQMCFRALKRARLYCRADQAKIPFLRALEETQHPQVRRHHPVV